MGDRRIILRAAVIVAALFMLGGEAKAQCSGQPPGNTVCAAPNGAAGLPGFRLLVPNDINAAVALAPGTTPVTGGTAGRMFYHDGSGKFSEFVAAGDCTFTAPNFLCTKTNGVNFAASATTDATNAANIGSGTLPNARLATGFVTAGSGLSGGAIGGGGTIAADIATVAQFAAATANKMLAADKVFGPEATLTYGTTTTIDFSTFVSNAAVTLTGNITTITLTNVKAGQAGMLRFIQDGTGSRTIPAALNSIFKCAGGCSYTLSTTANAVDVIGFVCVSATYCIGGALVKDVK
jgi:hypothetical protein